MTGTVYQTMLKRRSIRRYTSQPLTSEQVTRLLEAAMAAPSGHNKQPWHFVTVTRRDLLDRLAEVHPYARMLRQAPLGNAVCGVPASEFWVLYCAAATENILLAAVEEGLGAVWCGVHPHPELEEPVRQVLGIPREITPFCLIAVGHPAEEKEPRTQYREEKVHREGW